MLLLLLMFATVDCCLFGAVDDRYGRRSGRRVRGRLGDDGPKLTIVIAQHARAAAAARRHIGQLLFLLFAPLPNELRLRPIEHSRLHHRVVVGQIERVIYSLFRRRLRVRRLLHDGLDDGLEAALHGRRARRRREPIAAGAVAR